MSRIFTQVGVRISRNAVRLRGLRPGPVSCKSKEMARKKSAENQAVPAAGKRRPAKSDSVTPFPIVGIGASAGGLEALDAFVGNLPADTGMAFVVVTHQHPGHTSLLPELLSKETNVPVVTAEDGIVLRPNHIYVATPGGNLTMLNGRLHRLEVANLESPRLPIDHFFRSLAEDQRERAVCIVLSGTGTDGTLGLRAIKGASGMAMVQQPLSAKYAGMPSSAIATGLVDYVLPPEAMPFQLVAYVKGPYLQGAAVAAETPMITAEPMQKIFVLLRSRTGHDFSSYKSSTLRRRIERRMNVHQITAPNVYVRYLQENPHEIDSLFKELLISVTNFFRDPEAWETLGGEPLNALLKSRPDHHTIRVWVPGCATGEEVYTIAIILRESINRSCRHFDVQIFGTDLDSDAIESARSGRFPDGIAAEVSAERLQRYFVREDSTYRVRNEIREMAIFAPQNVIKDPPFTKLDMISCRNLLIYLNADLQKKLLPIFHYALRPGGILLLGPSETIGGFSDLFEVVDKHWKIFRRKEGASPVRSLPDIPAQAVVAGSETPVAALVPAPSKVKQISTIIERLLVARFVPASVVVTNRGDIVFIHGRTGSYLEPSEGHPRNNIIEMAREGLRIELAAAIRQASLSGQDVLRENIRVKTNGSFEDVHLSVARLHEPESARGLLLVTFRTAPPASPEPPSEGRGRKPGRKSEGDPNRIVQLEQELQLTRESLQTAFEELETSNEELKSANEELQSANEELQSINEELETSKEEMQSLNEELTTVNAELQSKVEDLSQANNDMQNLLNSTDVATIFLDHELNVKRYTDQARRLINLIPSDIGRPIGDLATNLRSANLAGTCEEVLRTLSFSETEVVNADGHWYLMRIMPYRTIENVIDGLVLTFVNIDRLKQLESNGSKAKQFFEAIVDTIREPLIILDQSLVVVSANRAFYRTFKTSSKQTLGEPVYELGAGQWGKPELRELLEKILPRNGAFEDFELEAEFPKIGHRVFILNARRLEQAEGLPGMILLSMEEATNP